ncbi:MAG: hypothetical protein K1W22_13900 [Lachnospiraceae bacterium]
MAGNGSGHGEVSGILHRYLPGCRSEIRKAARRKLFLLYLRPIINGTGNFYVEAQTRDETRTDIVVDYLGRQSIIEVKIWHEPKYNEDGEQQLIRYLDLYHLDQGYLLTFSFNKKKQPGKRKVYIQGKRILEITV